MPGPYRALLLDVMGTLVRDPFFEEIPAFFGMTLKELLAVKHRDAWVEFEHGRLDEATFLARFFADGRDYDQQGFIAHVRESYRWLPGVEPLLEELRARDVALYALSNYPTWYERIEEELALSRYLEWRFVSCKTGVRKPDPEAYLGPARALSLSPEQLLFVDDRDKNCLAAEAVGMGAIRFEDAVSLRRELVSRGVL